MRPCWAGQHKKTAPEGRSQFDASCINSHLFSSVLSGMESRSSSALGGY